MTDFSIKPDDFEPFDAGERLDAVFGHYHIGRDDEKRDEVALFFDAQLYFGPVFMERTLPSIIIGHNGRMIAHSEYASPEHSEGHLDQLLRANAILARSFKVVPPFDLAVVIVELQKPAITFVDEALQSCTGYFGYGNISWPSEFRSVITANQEYI